MLGTDVGMIKGARLFSRKLEHLLGAFGEFIKSSNGHGHSPLCTVSYIGIHRQLTFATVSCLPLSKLWSSTSVVLGDSLTRKPRAGIRNAALFYHLKIA